MVKKLQYFIVLATLVFSGFAFKYWYKGGVNAIKVIVIDAGHGGKDPGCQGTLHKEKDVSLAVALKLGKYIEENIKDVKVIYTRTTDVFVELEDRAQIANKAKADLFISIHCNAAGKPVMVKDSKTGKKRPKTFRNKKGKIVVVETTNPVPFGTETYVMGLKNEEGKMKVATRENSAIFYEDDYEKKYGGFDPESEESYIIMSNYTSAYVIQSASLAMKLQEEYGRKAGRIDKGVHRQSIWVLWRTSMPSILTEIGYLTNPLEETFLGSDSGQDYLAKAMFRGFRKYKDEVEGNKREYNDEFENQSPIENENIKAGNSPVVKKSEEEDEEENEVQKPEQKEEEKEPPVVETRTIEIPKPETKKPEPETKPKPIAIEQGSIALKQTKDTPAIKETQIKISDNTSPGHDAALTIAEKFKKENKTAPEVKKETPAEIKKEQEAKLVEIKKKEEALKTAIVFKVQFATSDIALNLKHEKFSSISDADFYRVNNTLKYTSGKFSNLRDAQAHQNFLREKGFKDCFVIAMQNGQRIDLAEAKKLTVQ